MIEEDVALTLDDSDEIGNKHTICSWGMCCNEPEVFDQPLDHIWPMDFKEQGRVAPLGAPKGLACPFRMEKPGLNGCFWSCRIFQAKDLSKFSKAEALAVWDVWIAQLETELVDDLFQRA